jgi:iron complex outermembrane receptor protein
LRGSFDRFTYDGQYPVAGDDASSAPGVGRQAVDGARWTVGGRLTHALPGRQVLTAGAEFIDNTRQNQMLRYDGTDAPVFDIQRHSTQRALYADDQVKLTDWLFVNGGLRYDGYEQFTRVTPRTGVIVMPSSTQSIKYLYGRAFRAPNEYELNSFYFGDSVSTLQPETVATHEVVWEGYTNDWLRTSVSTYRYRAEQLITLVADDSSFLGSTYVNTGRVVAKGLELEAQMRLPRGIQATSSYALQSAEDMDTGAGLPNSPRHMIKLLANGPTGFRSANLAADVIVVGPRRTLQGNIIGTAATTDVTFTMPLTARLSLSGSAYNLFDVIYADPGSDINRQDVIPQNGRTLRVGLRVTLWRP